MPRKLKQVQTVLERLCLLLVICQLLIQVSALSESTSARPSSTDTTTTDIVGANSSDNHTSHEHEEAGFAKPKVWLISFVSIVIISLVGLAGVAVVPLVRSTYYNHFIQYLVALAVGSLTGDAMLHLLPHAIVKSAMEDAHAERCHDEKQTVFKGLVALGGVYFFFMAEKIVALVSEYRSERHAIEEAASARRDADHTSVVGGDGAVGDNSQEDRRHHHQQGFDERRVPTPSGRLTVGKSCDEILAIGLSSKALRSIDTYKSTADNCHSDTDNENGGDVDEECQPLACPSSQDPTTIPMSNMLLQVPGFQSLPNSDTAVSAPETDFKNDVEPLAAVESDPIADISVAVPSGPASTAPSVSGGRKKRGKGHGHGHGHSHAHAHGHGHEMPQSLVSVAYMVIFGDGLHNFTDGLAIGAAFAQSITGGISTSIAVFCHELPHELGDFAVLLKTGLRVKQALLYNVLSSVLAAVGMVIGIFLGNVTSASYWIFAITGGIFIYISLVDMLPELNLVNVKRGESRIAHFVLQNAGIITGVGIMFVIAMFEDNIKHMLGDSGHAKIKFEGPC